MRDIAQDPCPERPRSLSQLAEDVRQARRLVDARRMSPVVGSDLTMAHRALLEAMEHLVSELIARRLPIPYHLRDALRLQRGCDSPPRAAP
jgi:hypothetical protein